MQAAFAAQEALAEAQAAMARSGAGDAMRCLDLEREMKALRMQLDPTLLYSPTRLTY